MKNVFITGGGGQDGLILSKIIKKRKKFNLNIILKKKSSFKLKGANYFINNLQEPKLVDQIFSKNKPFVSFLARYIEQALSAGYYRSWYHLLKDKNLLLYNLIL
jgi:N-acetyl-gamma-glutamylphosphate reductase